MPWGHQARAVNKPKMIDMDEPAEPKPVEPPIQPLAELDIGDEEEEEYEETVTIRASNFPALQDTLDDMRF